MMTANGCAHAHRRMGVPAPQAPLSGSSMPPPELRAPVAAFQVSTAQRAARLATNAMTTTPCRERALSNPPQAKKNLVNVCRKWKMTYSRVNLAERGQGACVQ